MSTSNDFDLSAKAQTEKRHHTNMLHKEHFGTGHCAMQQSCNDMLAPGKHKSKQFTQGILIIKCEAHK